MKLRRRKPLRQSETIIALIDVVFFLLVFFMLVGRMDATAPFDLTPPIAAFGSDLPGGGTTLSISADGKIAMDGRLMEEREVLSVLADQLDKQPSLRVRLNSDGETELGHILPLAEKIEALGARDVVLIVVPGTAP